MSLYLVDSGVWIGAFNPRDRHHGKAKPMVQAVSDGALGKVLITDHIFGEVTTYLRKRSGPTARSWSARQCSCDDQEEGINGQTMVQ